MHARTLAIILTHLCDGVIDLNIATLIKYHKKHGKTLTMTAVQPAGRYGALEINGENLITEFEEKPSGDGSWINGGYFVCEPPLLDLIYDDETLLERNLLQHLALNKELVAYRHGVFGNAWIPLAINVTLKIYVIQEVLVKV